MIKDIKEQKEIEIELRKAKEYSDLLFQLTPSGIFFLDKDKIIKGWNIKAEKITGYSKEEIIGQKCTLFLESPCDEICQDFSRHIKTSKDNEECVIITKDGNKKTIIKNMDLLYDEKNNVIGAIESFNDITEVKKLEEFKDTIEKTLRHDLKNSLSAIIGFPTIILYSDNLTASQKEMLNSIIEVGNIMLNQIDLYLNIFKIEQNKYVFKPHPVDIIKLTRKVCFDLSNLATKKNILINIFFNEKPIVEDNNDHIFMLDDILYYAMLSNIVKNAIEASPDKESVSVKIYTREKLKIVVHNQGVIPVEIRLKFFKKFSSYGKSDGLGLGVYSAKIMAEVMGGKISFETNEQEGTNIIIIFDKF